MSNIIETRAHLLVRLLYSSTSGRPMRWPLRLNLDDVTVKAIAFAVDRGWLLVEDGHSICLTDEARKLIS